jgi:hypothetical protein
MCIVIGGTEGFGFSYTLMILVGRELVDNRMLSPAEAPAPPRPDHYKD